MTLAAPRTGSGATRNATASLAASPTDAAVASAIHPREGEILFLLMAVQFVNILDFMMVMPLGPDFARALDIPPSFTHRSAPGCRVVRRTLHGADPRDRCRPRPPSRRGKAMGVLMGGFALASVLGVPLGLKLEEWGSWRTPFLGVGANGLLTGAMAFCVLPTVRGHLRSGTRGRQPWLVRPEHLVTYALAAAGNMSTFLVIPNLSAFLQENLATPRARLGALYMVGGVVSFSTTRVGGSLADRIGSRWVGTGGTVLVAAVTWGELVHSPPVFVPMAFFITLMFASGLGNVSFQFPRKQGSAPRRARAIRIVPVRGPARVHGVRCDDLVGHPGGTA